MKQGKYAVVLFDFDGTIVDSSEGIYNGLRYAFCAHQKPIPSDAILKKFIGPPLIDSFREFMGYDDALSYAMIDSYRVYYNETGWKEVRVYAGIESLLATLHEQGIKLGTASTKPALFVERILEHVGLLSYFDHIGGTDFSETPQTKAQIIANGMQNLGGTVQNTLMVGDRKFDIDGAREVGLPVAAVLYGFGNRAEFLEHQATYIAETVDDLKQWILN